MQRFYIKLHHASKSIKNEGIVILCYALFFDREEPLTPVDEMNYTIPTEAREQIHLSDSTVYYAKCINPLF